MVAPEGLIKRLHNFTGFQKMQLIFGFRNVIF